MRYQLVLHRQYKPVPYHIIHYQVEEGGRDESALSSPPSCFEVRAVLPFLAGDDLLLVPKHYQELAHMETGAVYLQSRQEAASIHSVIRILEVQENQERGILVNTSQILCHIELQYEHPHHPRCAEAI